MHCVALPVLPEDFPVWPLLPPLPQRPGGGSERPLYPQLRIGMVMKTYFSGIEKSSILGVWMAPGGPRNHTKRRGASRPTFWSVFWSPGAVQTPRTDDLWVPGKLIFMITSIRSWGYWPGRWKHHCGRSGQTKEVKGILKWFCGQVFLLEAWCTKANKPHIFKNIIVFWLCRRRRQGQQTAHFWKRCCF
jgi:hypothetical protein